MGSIEVRLLGRLQVRRADGTMVDNAEWRTGKTADLVRLLTLAAGRPVRVEFVAEAIGRRTRYVLAYDHSQAPGRLSWSLVEVMTVSVSIRMSQPSRFWS